LNKILNILLIGLIIIVVVGLFYLAIPKYQVNIANLKDGTVILIKMNTLTGKIETEIYSPSITHLPRKEYGSGVHILPERKEFISYEDWFSLERERKEFISYKDWILLHKVDE
jgi:hypothetical protein